MKKWQSAKKHACSLAKLLDLFSYLKYSGTRGNAAGSSQTGDALGKALASVSIDFTYFAE